MDIRRVFGIFKKYILLIICVTLIATILTFILTVFVIDKTYQAEAVMIISSHKNTNEIQDLTYNEYNLNLKLVNSYRELCKTDRIMKKVIEEVSIDLQPNELSERVSIVSLQDTEIIKISAKDTNPEMAARITNAVASIFVQEIPAIMQMDNIQIIDYADIPTMPFAPNVVSSTIIAFFLCLILSCSIAMMVDHLDNTLKDREWLEDIIKVPVIGTVPKFESKNTFSDKSTNNVGTADVHAREAYNRIYMNINFLGKDEKCLLITSSVASEGKTTTATNIAVSMAMIGKKVLLIDADMRRSSVHTLLGISNKYGLSDLLVSSTGQNTFIVNSKLENMSVITAGRRPPNPTRLLGSDRMGYIIQQAKEIYDYIIIDSPPVLVSPDALSLSRWIDGVILITRYAFSKKPEIKLAQNELSLAKTPTVGIIINRFGEGNKSHYGYGYYYSQDLDNNKKSFIKKVSTTFITLKKASQKAVKWSLQRCNKSKQKVGTLIQHKVRKEMHKQGKEYKKSKRK